METNPKEVFCGWQMNFPGITFDQEMFWFESFISSVPFERLIDLICDSFYCEKSGVEKIKKRKIKMFLKRNSKTFIFINYILKLQDFLYGLYLGKNLINRKIQ